MVASLRAVDSAFMDELLFGGGGRVRPWPPGAAVNFRGNRERRFDAFDVAFHRLDQQEMAADVTLDLPFIVLIGLVEVES